MRNWLTALVWPEHHERRERLTKALDFARHQNLQIVKGDVLDDLPSLLGKVPVGLKTVVLHSAVLNYVIDEDKRRAFSAYMQESDALWLSCESPSVFPWLKAPHISKVESLRYIMRINGEPIAKCAPHGGNLEWFEGAQQQVKDALAAFVSAR